MTVSHELRPSSARPAPAAAVLVILPRHHAHVLLQMFLVVFNTYLAWNIDVNSCEYTATSHSYCNLVSSFAGHREPLCGKQQLWHYIPALPAATPVCASSHNHAVPANISLVGPHISENLRCLVNIPVTPLCQPVHASACRVCRTTVHIQIVLMTACVVCSHSTTGLLTSQRLCCICTM